MLCTLQMAQDLNGSSLECMFMADDFSGCWHHSASTIFDFGAKGLTQDGLLWPG